jgi:hypothetical protein
LALVYTTTLLADHKGNTRPKVCGDEYVVDAVLDITSHVRDGAEIPASAFGLSTVHAVSITGHEGANSKYAQVLITAETGVYESATSFMIIFTDLDGTNASSAADDADPACSVRLRIWGNL